MSTPNLTDLPVYKVLRGEPLRKWRFTEIERRSEKTARVVSLQLKRLVMADLVTCRAEPNPSDWRSKRTYQLSPTWPWRQHHQHVIDDVARAISKWGAYEGLTSGALDHGRDGSSIYNLLVVDRSAASARLSYPRGAVNLRKVKAAVEAVRRALRGEDPEGYHWHYLLRQIITEVVTAQPRSYFLLSYPSSCILGAGEAVHWPDPRWKTNPGRTSMDVHLTSRQREFVGRHGGTQGALAVVKRWPRRSVKMWEQALQESDYSLSAPLTGRSQGGRRRGT